MFIQTKKYGNDDIVIVSKSGKIGSIYTIGKGIPTPLFGGSTTTLEEWNHTNIVAKLTVHALIERLNYTGYLLTDIKELQLDEMENILKQLNDNTLNK